MPSFQFFYLGSLAILVETYMQTIGTLVARWALPTGFRPAVPHEQGADHQPDDCSDKHCRNTDKGHFFPWSCLSCSLYALRVQEYQYDNGKYAAPGALRP